MLLGAVWGAKSKSPLLRKSIYIALSVLAFIYAVDASIIYHLDNRLSVDNFLKFVPEWRALISFINLKAVIVLLLMTALLFIKAPINKRLQRTWLILSITLVLSGLLPTRITDPSAHKYITRFISPNKLFGSGSDPGLAELIALQMTKYGPEELNKYAPLYPRRPLLALPDQKTNFIVILVESLTAIDSYKISSTFNRLPKFDQMAEDGTLFTNFFANYSDTEGGLVSTIQGITPIPPPNGTRNIYRTFIVLPSIVPQLHARNYHTEFLTTASLSFLNKGDYLKDLGFKVVRGRNEVEVFRKAPKFAFDAPSDAVLYKEMLNRVDILAKEQQPYFFLSITVSSHRPWKDPLGRSDTEENVWQFVDEELSKLYKELKRRDFFESGILVVLGDHRKMMPLNPAEIKRYAETADARVPLLLIGKGVQAGRIDSRAFQQSDLFPKFAEALDPAPALTEYAVYISTYGRIQRTSSAPLIRIFEDIEGDSPSTFYLEPLGRHLRWRGKPPANAEEILRHFHAIRARHQERLENRPDQCSFDAAAGRPSQETGLLLRTYRGTNISGDFSKDRFIKEQVINRLDYRSAALLEPGLKNNFALQLKGFIEIERPGVYEFRTHSEGGICMAIGRRAVIEENYKHERQPHFGRVELDAGIHPLEIRISQYTGLDPIAVNWRAPGEAKIKELDFSQVLLPE